MKIKISHSKPTLSASEIKSVRNVLKSGHIAKGQKVKEFEDHFCAFQGIKGAVALNSGSSALHMALLALGIKEGDEVIIPSYSCAALLNAVLYTRASPVIVDINKDDYNISLEAVRKNLTSKTKAIIVVHNFGLPALISPLKKLGVPIIEDCAHAIGAKYKDQLVGCLGDISIFSFYATKMLTTAEGGMVASNKVSFINKIRNLIEYDQMKQFELRYNYKMTDIQASIGIEQLKKLSFFISRRNKIAEKYTHFIGKTDDLLPYQEFADREHVYYRYIRQLAKRGNIDNILVKLNQAGIECRKPVFQPLHRLWKSTKCPISEAFMHTAISVPIYPSLPLSQVRFIAEKLLQCVK